MRLIEREQTEFARHLPRNPIHGVELEGQAEALQLVQRLGAYATVNLAPRWPINPGDSLVPELATELATQALSLQRRIIDELTSGAIPDDTYTMRATAPSEGRILEAAVSLDDEVLATTAKPLVDFKILALG